MTTPTLAESLTAATAAVVAASENYQAKEERVALREAGVVAASGLPYAPDDPTELARAGSIGARFVLAPGGGVNALPVSLAGGAVWPGLLEGMTFTLPTIGPNTGPVTVMVQAGFAIPPAAAAGSGLPAGTLRLLTAKGGQLKAGDLDGSSIRVRADGAGGLRMTGLAASETSGLVTATTVNPLIKQYLAGLPPVQVVTVDAVNGSESNDGSLAAPRKDIDAVLDTLGTTATQLFLLSDVTIRRRRNAYASLNIQGIAASGGSTGYTPSYRAINFLGTADNSPGPGVGTFSSGLFLLNTNLSFDHVNCFLPAAVPGQDYIAHITSNSGTNFIIQNFGVLVQSTAAGTVFGSTSTPIEVYGSVGFGPNAAGHLFEGVPAGANPNAAFGGYRYRSNITSA